MEILARAVGRRKEAVAQVQFIRGTGQFIINTKSAQDYLQNDSCSILDVQAPFEIFKKNTPASDKSSPEAKSAFGWAEGTNNTVFSTIDTVVKVKGGGFKGQVEAIRLGIARALCIFETNNAWTSKKTSSGLNSEVSKEQKDLSELEAHKDNNSNLKLEISGRSEETSLEQTLSNGAGVPNVGLRKQLKDKGYLTQDSRVKERRKYGLKKARKASQYHKR